LINFPLAAGYVWAAIDITSRYTVTVTNAGTLTPDHVIFIAPGVRTDLGAIPPGASRTTSFHFTGDGTLDLETQYGLTVARTNVEPYVTNNLGGSKAVTLRDPPP
jgi:hypothetical protein